ncbi:MAG TPA: hypothetical protein VFE45_01720, partial [Coriobacteriia bacterium]|nr:hypothetical protein [Coriobacteriia bacterium]
AACGSQKLVVSESDVKAIFGSIKITIDGGKFDTSLASASGNTTVKIKGRLKGSRASGTVRVAGAGAGGSTCDTGKLKWEAKRKS